MFLNTDEQYPHPGFLLAQIPDGESGDKSAIQEWETKTKWISQCLMKLSNYSP
jgi:hypothetical protein